MVYSAEVERALRVCIDAHEGQVRKGERVPYAVHPYHVALMLTRWGLDEEVVQAGLLHDVVEDCEDWTIERVEGEFGARVAGLVGEVTEDKSLTWEERKRGAVEHAATMSEAAVLVKAADKLHNLECLRASLRSADDTAAIWAQFRGGRERTLEMSAELVEALVPRVPAEVGAALRAAVADLKAF